MKKWVKVWVFTLLAITIVLGGCQKGVDEKPKTDKKQSQNISFTSRDEFIKRWESLAKEKKVPDVNTLKESTIVGFKQKDGKNGEGEVVIHWQPDATDKSNQKPIFIRLEMTSQLLSKETQQKFVDLLLESALKNIPSNTKEKVLKNYVEMIAYDKEKQEEFKKQNKTLPPKFEKSGNYQIGVFTIDDDDMTPQDDTKIMLEVKEDMKK